MRRLFLACIGVLWLVTPAEANWAAVAGQTATTTNSDDPTMTFTSPIGSGNVVIIVATTTNEAQTVSITNSTFSWNTSVGPIDSAGFVIRTYIFCGVGDGTDGTFTVTTSGTTSVLAMGIEFTGGTCTLDGAAQSNDDTTSPENLTTNVTVTGSNSLLIGSIRSDSAANFDPGASMVQFGNDGLALAAEYRILVASGSFDTPWTSAANENALMVGVAFQASGATSGAGLLLRRVGGN